MKWVMRFAIAALVALGVMFGVKDSDEASAAHLYDGSGFHWQRFGNNPTYGRFLFIRDVTFNGFQWWDQNIPPSGGLYDFQNEWNEALKITGSGTWSLALVTGANPLTGFGDIDVTETWQEGTAWCGGVQAQGCFIPYVDGNNHLFYGHAILNAAVANGSGGWAVIQPFDRKVVLCHEIGHGLGLGHTGVGGHAATDSCMDTGSNHFDFSVPSSHDADLLLQMYYTLGHYPGGAGSAPTNMPPEHITPNGKRFDGVMKQVQKNLPPHVRKAIREGKVRLGKIHALAPVRNAS